MSWWTILLAILVFSIIIIIHEFGHFIVAKWNKVGVIEFSLGMGPRIISWGKTENGYKVLFFKSSRYLEENPIFGDNTLYSWKLLPFGGSCMMVGEEEQSDAENSFGKKSVYARMAIVFAGPFFNFLLAFLLSVILIASVGYNKAAITEVEPNCPMAEAGLQEGDIITEINGTDIVISGEIGNYTAFHPLQEGEEVTIKYERNENGKIVEKTAIVIPRKLKDDDGTESVRMGFSYGVREKQGVLGTLKYAGYEVKYWIVTVVQSLGQMISGKVSTDDISGPVGIVQVISDSAAQGAEAAGVPGVVLNLMALSILLTANLGVMNLLPIPALDGGRLLIYIIEWIRRKPINPKYENYINMVGFMLLMALMVFILGNDIFKLFK